MWWREKSEESGNWMSNIHGGGCCVSLEGNGSRWTDLAKTLVVISSVGTVLFCFRAFGFCCSGMLDLVLCIAIVGNH